MEEAAEEGTSLQVTQDPETGHIATFLNEIEQTDGIPVIEDIVRLKPEQDMELTSPEYAQAWESAVKTLCKSFSRDQVAQLFLSAVNTKDRLAHLGTKRQLAQRLIEIKWGWRNPVDIQQEETKKHQVMARSKLLLIGISVGSRICSA